MITKNLLLLRTLLFSFVFFLTKFVVFLFFITVLDSFIFRFSSPVIFVLIFPRFRFFPSSLIIHFPICFHNILLSIVTCIPILQISANLLAVRPLEKFAHQSGGLNLCRGVTLLRINLSHCWSVVHISPGLNTLGLVPKRKYYLLQTSWFTEGVSAAFVSFSG